MCFTIFSNNKKSFDILAAGKHFLGDGNFSYEQALRPSNFFSVNKQLVSLPGFFEVRDG